MSKCNNHMMKTVLEKILVAIVLVMPSTFAEAADIGAPATKADVNGAVRTELIYEKYDRKVEFTKADFTEIGPSGTFNYTVEGESGKQEENRVILRILVPVSEKTIIHGDLGTTDSKESEGSVPLFGLGLKYAEDSENNTKIGFFIQGHYISEIEYKATDVDPTYGPGTFTQNESYYEISTGLHVAKVLLLENKTKMVPYAGAMISILNGKEDFDICYGCGSGGAALKITGSGDLKEEGIIAIFVGADLTFESDFGFHMEGRFINQSSVSASLFMSF